MVAHTEKLKDQFNKVYQKSLQNFKTACLEKHKDVVESLQTQIKHLHSQNLSNQVTDETNSRQNSNKNIFCPSKKCRGSYKNNAKILKNFQGWSKKSRRIS